MKSTRTQSFYLPVETAFAQPKPQLYTAQLSATALYFLRQQLGRDIDTVRRGWNQIGFTRQELLHMQKLLLVHPDNTGVEAHDNILLTHTERGLLIIYTNRYLQLALDTDPNSTPHLMYADTLYALRKEAILLTCLFPLPPLYYGFYSHARSLAKLWARLGALLGLPVVIKEPAFEEFTTVS